jgi:SpoVK/Ycf46/Vps4 family AAA+-type ATPase
MATTKSLTRLFRAIASDDLQAAESQASAICREEDRKGHRAAARQLRGALHASRLNGGTVNGQSSNGSFPFAALTKLASDVSLADVVLSNGMRSQILEVAREWTHRGVLSKRGIPHRSKLMFYGPPGCGKSMTARAIGRELGLPVFVVRFDAVIGAYLGQTAIHLRQLFSFAEMTPCVLLLDELDALGKQRGNPLDVGELDRIVIALMQELEHSKPKGFIVATSNLPKHLDAALWRRFDLALEFKAPPRSVLAKYAVDMARSYKTRLTPQIRAKASTRPSFAAARAIILDEARRQALRKL